MQKIGIVITDGVGYRNFVMSSFFSYLITQYNQVVIYSGLPKNVYEKNLGSYKNIIINELIVFEESKINWFYRKLKEVAHMYLHRDFYGIQDTLERGYPKGNTKRGLIVKVIYAIAKLFHSEKNIQYYEKRQFHTFRKNPITISYANLLDEDQPNLLFFTHQRPPYLAPFLAIAKKKNIKTTSFIFSWDNLASKGRMLGSFDGYFVWSKLMKDELLYFYPTVIEKNIKIVGTPQFEPYVMDEYVPNRNQFIKKFNIDIAKKIICYSCADSSIGINDEVHIRSIMNYIKDKKIQLLVRTSPADNGSRFKELVKEFTEIIWNHPKWKLCRDNHVESWSQRIPTKEDIIDLKSLLKFSDLNINMCSTMSLDFMLFDKPVINTVFGNEENGFYNDQRFLNYLHYKYVIDSKAVTIARDEVELHAQIEESLSTPNLRALYRKELIDLEIGGVLKGTSKRIVEVLKTL